MFNIKGCKMKKLLIATIPNMIEKQDTTELSKLKAFFK